MLTLLFSIGAVTHGFFPFPLIWIALVLFWVARCGVPKSQEDRRGTRADKQRPDDRFNSPARRLARPRAVPAWTTRPVRRVGRIARVGVDEQPDAASVERFSTARPDGRRRVVPDPHLSTDDLVLLLGKALHSRNSAHSLMRLTIPQICISSTA